MHSHSEIRAAISTAARSLADAGISSAQVDAELLAAHVAGVDRSRLAFLEVPGEFTDRYRELVDARAKRIPLQHLTGVAPFGPLTLHVGPGVFIPRPETESMLEWATTAVENQRDPFIVDLCTGTGALAVALARQRPDATVIAVDDSADALRYASRNAAGTAVELVEADVTEPGLLPGLEGRVDLLVCNPPYIPDGAELEPEVAEHDPHHALFGGADGMAVIRAVVELATRLLRPGGRFAVEHDDTTSRLTVEIVTATGLFDDIVQRADLAGRPRFVTAVRASGQETRRESGGQS